MCDHLTGALEQRRENFERKSSEPDGSALLAELPGTQIDFKLPKGDNLRVRMVPARLHGPPQRIEEDRIKSYHNSIRTTPNSSAPNGLCFAFFLDAFKTLSIEMEVPFDSIEA